VVWAFTKILTKLSPFFCPGVKPKWPIGAYRERDTEDFKHREYSQPGAQARERREKRRKQNLKPYFSSSFFFFLSGKWKNKAR
jgi:hypothetical protein